MTRTIGRLVDEEDLALAEINLVVGPLPLCEYTDEELKAGWALLKDKIMRNGRKHGNRPWAWWVYEQGGDPPPLERGASEVRLAELGELTDEELAELAKRAADAEAVLESGIKCYVSTGGGRQINIEQDAIDLYERVKEALEP